MAKPKVGDLFQDRYLILSELGAGGMGTVFRAKQLDANREVAIKIPHIERLSNDEDLARFYREFKLLSCLSNLHIMAIYGLALDDSSMPYAVCEYIEGSSLRTALQAGAMPWRRTVQIAIQICLAMQEAHENGIIHRDLKPENVLLVNDPENDFVKLIDFGLSRMFLELSESQKITKSWTILGSIHYMAPEQISNIKVDHRSDIYSFGCLLFELLSGSYLFDADSTPLIIYKHCKESPESRLDTLRTLVPKELLQIMRITLEKDPEKRFQSMEQLAASLQELSGCPEMITLGKATRLKQVAGNLQASRWNSGLTAAVLLLLVVLSAMFAFVFSKSNTKVSNTKVVRLESRKVEHPHLGKRTVFDSSNKDWKSKIAYLSNCIELDPTNVNLYLERAHSYPSLEDEGQWRKAMDDCIKAISLDPENSNAYLFRGSMYQRGKVKDLQKALDDCNKALSLNPKNAFAFAVRADVYYSLGQWRKTIDDCNKAISLDKGYKTAKCYIIRANAINELKQKQKTHL